MKILIHIIFFLISIIHLNVISSAGAFSFGENHFHVELEEFNYHADDTETHQESDSHHKHRHQKNEKEHEHSHILSLEHKEMLVTYFINIFHESVYIKLQSPLWINNLKISDTQIEVFRPPIFC